MGKTHLVLGAACSVASAAILPLNIAQSGAWIAIATICSLAPDLDGKKATLSKYVPPLSWLVRLLAAGVYKITATPLDGPTEKGVHRRLTHTPFFIFLIGGTLIAFTNPIIGGAFIAGNFFHLLGDASSRSGLPWLAPFKYKGKRWYDFRVPKRFRFRVGSPFEENVLRPLCFILLFLSVILYSYLKVV